MTYKKSIWIVIDHPNQIINAIGLSIYFKDFSRVNLLISKHHYWNKINSNFLKKYFVSITFFPKVEFSKVIPREIFKMIKAFLKISLLSVNSNDIFLILSDNVILEPLIFRRFHKNKKYKLFPRHIKHTKYVKFDEYYEKTISIVWKNIFKLFTLEPILYLQHLNDPKIFLLSYQNKLEKIFNYVFYFSSPEHINSNNKSKIPELTSYVRNKSLSLKKKMTNEKLKIIFFGGALHEQNNYQINFTNKCLRYIERFFPNSKYYYKIHPHDITEHSSINLGNFELYNKQITTEILLINNEDNISHFFSVSSNSIASCIDFGYNNSYLFLNLYKDYTPYFKKALNYQFHSLKAIDAIFINNFDFPPKKYMIDRDVLKISDHLDNLKKIVFKARNI